MREQASVAICDASFGSADPPPPAQHHTFGFDHSGLGCDWPHQRNFEFQRCLADALFQSRLHREAHTAIEQRRCKPAMHRTGRVEQSVIGLCDNDDAPVRGLRHVVAECSRDRVEARHSLNIEAAIAFADLR